MKKLPAALALCALLCFASVAPSAVNDEENAARESTAHSLSVRLFYDDTYYIGMPSPLSTVTTEFGWAAQAFERKWDILLNPTAPAKVSIPVVNLCARPVSMYCDDAVCGSPCSNSSDGTVHHKNGFRIIAKTQTDFSLSGSDLMVTLLGVPLCYVRSDGTHGAHLGCANRVGGTHAITSNLRSHGNILRIRIMQHEMSHFFGCRDAVCHPDDRCIMKGSFDAETNLQEYNLWCRNCRTDFNPSAHD
ncbi:MAG: hypothetical protein DBY36_05530 [Clostridiales bacterium]|nr:MAG: hypothetical protein DBY36_05530 [Clostridiales bacterium]